MQNNVSKDEISKTSLWTDTIELVLVLWIHLQPKAHCKRKKDAYLTLRVNMQDIVNACWAENIKGRGYLQNMARRKTILMDLMATGCKITKYIKL
jgi:hypothetical protein